MSERPFLQHGGRRYERQRSTWLDGGLTVPRALSHELDSTAKKDPDLWELCEAQDFKDDPRNRGKFRMSRKELTGFSLVRALLGSSSDFIPQPVRG